MIGAIVEGMMGIEPDRDGTIRTLSRLTEATPRVALESLPVVGVEIDLEHEGRRRSVLRNRSEATVRWRAAFAGRHGTLLLGEEARPASVDVDLLGQEISWLDVSLASGETAVVTVSSTLH